MPLNANNPRKEPRHTVQLLLGMWISYFLFLNAKLLLVKIQNQLWVKPTSISTILQPSQSTHTRPYFPAK